MRKLIDCAACCIDLAEADEHFKKWRELNRKVMDHVENYHQDD